MESSCSSAAVQHSAVEGRRQLRNSNRISAEQETSISKAAGSTRSENSTSVSRKRRRSAKSPPNQTKKRTSSRKTELLQSQAEVDGSSEADTSETLAILSDPSDLLSRSLKKPVPNAAASCARVTRQNAKLPVTYEDVTISGAEAQLPVLKQSLADAEKQLQHERDQRAQHERQIRQDMYLEMLQTKESTQREVEKLERHLRTASKLIDENDLKMHELQQRYDSISESLGRHLVENEAQKQDVQHLQSLNTTLEGDIDELRQIHNEASAAKRPPGLPPAYGSLDEEDIAPYQLHKDSGALTLATLKRAARERFDTLRREIDEQEIKTSLAKELTASPGVKTFFATSTALYKTASTLAKALKEQATECSFDIHASDKSDVRRVPASKSFLASRIVNLILELGWRTVSLNELRPECRHFSPRATVLLQRMYSAIDDIFVESLRQWNAENCGGMHAPAEGSRAAAFQAYLSQLSALRCRVEALIAHTRKNWSGQLFGKSLDFLQDSVESERMLEANSSSQREGGDARADREGSVISSEGIRDEIEDELNEEYLVAVLALGPTADL